MILRALLHDAATQLVATRAAGDLDEGRLEAELLYGAAAGLERTQVIARGSEDVTPEVSGAFEALLARRLAREPLAYILGRRECYGMTFEVGRGVLVPRPETELLIETTLAAVREHPSARRLVRVVDVGTGCGVVALAVAWHAPNAKLYALDRATAALAVAGRNRTRFGLRNRVVLLQGDLFDALPERVEVVTANLPYVPTVELEALAPEVRDWEPAWALNGGKDGLEMIRRLIYCVPEYLAGGPRAVLLEVGDGQATKVARLLAAAVGGPARLHADLAGRPRVVEVRVGY